MRISNPNKLDIRAKICNFIGNICRYSHYFYEVLLRNDLISDAIQCCKDVDKNVRKFACFAVGNAGFHNDRLYEHLRPCVPLLVDLLRDSEVIKFYLEKLILCQEKTRANAAGALGNFVRNSSALTRDLIKHGALQELLNVVENDTGDVISSHQNPFLIFFRQILQEELHCFQLVICAYIQSVEKSMKTSILEEFLKDSK